jgi:hypothetical protein
MSSSRKMSERLLWTLSAFIFSLSLLVFGANLAFSQSFGDCVDQMDQCSVCGANEDKCSETYNDDPCVMPECESGNCDCIPRMIGDEYDCLCST